MTYFARNRNDLIASSSMEVQMITGSELPLKKCKYGILIVSNEDSLLPIYAMENKTLPPIIKGSFNGLVIRSTLITRELDLYTIMMNNNGFGTVYYGSSDWVKYCHDYRYESMLPVFVNEGDLHKNIKAAKKNNVYKAAKLFTMEDVVKMLGDDTYDPLPLEWMSSVHMTNNNK